MTTRSVQFAKWLSDENSIATYKHQSEDTIDSTDRQLMHIMQRLSKIELELEQLKSDAAISTSNRRITKE